MCVCVGHIECVCVCGERRPIGVCVCGERHSVWGAHCVCGERRPIAVCVGNGTVCVGHIESVWGTAAHCVCGERTAPHSGVCVGGT